MNKRFFCRHEDDYGIDEVLFVAPVPKTVVPINREEALAHAFLHLAIIERYKTSGLSGNEWRFGAGLYVREEHRADWRLVSTYIDLKGAMAFVYPELYGDFITGKWTAAIVTRKVGAITFSWKGHPVWSSSYDGAPTDLLVAAGHLPFAWIQSGDHGSDPSPLKTLCAQPGCANPHVSVYRLKKRYCHQGHATDPVFSEDVRGFCAKHLRRGDCGLDDADANYEVVSGPGPDGHEPNPDVVKQAVMGPPIVLPPEALGG